jgi:hypothetical protein
MRARIYEIEDENILETFFGDDPKPSKIYNVAHDHGTLIFDGEVDWLPESGSQLDSITIDGKSGQDEYIVVAKTIYADENIVIVIVHPLQFVDMELS